MPTDEELAKIAYEASVEGMFRPTWDDLAVKWTYEKEPYRRIARAVRQALTPVVAPLRPGETVGIRSTNGTSDVFLFDNDGAGLAITFRDEDDWETNRRTLDAGGVAQLEETCRRFRAAQRENHDDR